MEKDLLTTDDYILKLREISTFYDDKIFEMMEHYNVNALRELSLEQVKSFYESKKGNLYENNRIVY